MKFADRIIFVPTNFFLTPHFAILAKDPGRTRIRFVGKLTSSSSWSGNPQVRQNLAAFLQITKMVNGLLCPEQLQVSPKVKSLTGISRVQNYEGVAGTSGMRLLTGGKCT